MTHGRTTGWLVSLLLHSCVVLASVNMFSTLKIVPTNPELFSWDVSLVEAPHSGATGEPAETRLETSKIESSHSASAPPTSVQSDQPPPPTPVNRQVETTSVVESVEREVHHAVETVQPTQQAATITPTPIITPAAPERITAVSEAAPDDAPAEKPVVEKPPDVTETVAQQEALNPEKVIEATEVAKVETPAPPPAIVESQSVAEMPRVTPAATNKQGEVLSEKAVEPAAVATADAAAVMKPSAQEPISSPVPHTPVPTVSPSDNTKHEADFSPPPSSGENSVSRTPVSPGPAESPQPASATPEANKQVARAPRTGSAAKADYGWLAESLWRKVAELKRYPLEARLNRWEGKVVLKAVIKEDGHLGDLKIQQSSGYEVLDQDAMELIRRVCPLHMKHSLGRPDVAIQIPINYALR